MISLSDILGDNPDPFANAGQTPPISGGMFAAKVKPRLFDQGGAGRAVAGYLGDALARIGGQQGVYAPMMAHQQELQQQQIETQRQQMLLRQKQMQPEILNTGDGQVLSVNPATMQIQELHAARPIQTKPTEQQQLIDQWNSLPADDPRRPLYERAIRGYQYTAPVLDAKQGNALDLINARSAASIAAKQTPSYSNLHPSSGGGGGRVTATAKARYINEAEAAIKRGAPRAAVYERLAKMGIH